MTLSRARMSALRLGVWGLTLVLPGCSTCRSPTPTPTLAGEDAGRAKAIVVEGALLPPPTALGLEAEITVRVESPRLTVNEEHTFAVKGDRVRFTIPADTPSGAPSFGIFDTSSRTLYKRRDAEQTYTLLDVAMPRDARYDAGAWRVEKTGQKLTVDGHSCEIWKLDRPQRKATACVASGIAYIDFALLTKRVPRAECAEELGARGVFPLRIEEFDETGALAVKSFVLHMTLKAFPETHFIVPGGYRQVKAFAPVLLPQ